MYSNVWKYFEIARINRRPGALTPDVDAVRPSGSQCRGNCWTTAIVRHGEMPTSVGNSTLNPTLSPMPSPLPLQSTQTVSASPPLTITAELLKTVRLKPPSGNPTKIKRPAGM